MLEIAKDIAANPYLQAIAIIVALGTLGGFILKYGLVWLKFIRTTIQGGLRKAIRRIVARWMYVARRDSNDPILYISTILRYLVTIILQTVLVTFYSAIVSSNKLREIDDYFGTSMENPDLRVIANITYILMIFVVLGGVVFQLINLIFYNRMVRRHRIRRIRAYVSSDQISL